VAPEFSPKDFRILVVDDDPNICEVIGLYLKSEGFHVLSAADGADGMKALEQEEVHGVVLDVMMPGMDGWEMCQAIRRDHHLPVLMVTARGEMSDKLKGLELGADDYLVKPFNPKELVARMVALLRRTYGWERPRTRVTTLRFGALVIDKVAHEVFLRGERMDLSPREFQLLYILAQHPNQVLDRQQLLDLVWGVDFVGEDRVVDVLVKRLRSKISKSEDYEVCSVRGIGYKFRVYRNG
jgi:DNA-binding response OmpR family regulator